MPEDLFVDAPDGIRIAVHDHGGSGPDLLLLHGAGANLLSLFNLARKFEADHRVVTMDARWSGQSGDADHYDWTDLVGDVEAVVDQLGLDAPVVAGHSWGGMIAAYYGAAHPDARAVINLDGHGSGNPSLFDGITAEEHQRGMAMIEAAGSLPPLGEGDDAWKQEAWAEVRSRHEAMGVPAELVDEFTDRDFVEVEPGRWRRHPSPTLLEGLRGDLDLFSLYRRVACPLQIFNCTADQPGYPPELVAFMAAYRRGLTRALDELALERQNIDVVLLPDLDHNGLVARGAKVVAAEVRRFLASLP